MTGPLDPVVVPPHYASGSLPRLSNRRPSSRNSASLTRACSMRSSWAATKRPIKTMPITSGQHSPPSVVSSILPTDSVSVNNRQLTNSINRDKYNTLTPAEAKKLTRCLGGRPPTRTASVLHKPRAPPIIVTNLDDYGTYSSRTTRTTSDNRNSKVNNSRNSIYFQNTRSPSRSSPNDSESNLSYRSSLDVVSDSAYGSDRLQTMSVELGHPSQMLYNSKDHFSEKNKLSDDSYSSAKSSQSESVKLKSSLSSSTSRVFQNQLFNLKKFFRCMPSRKSLGFSLDHKQSPGLNRSSRNDGKTLEESISQICLNKSQSPPVCPPPPGELKSMAFIENSVNYSNYDDFTRARNQQTSTLLNGHLRNQMQFNDYTRAEDNGLTCEDQVDSDAWQLSSLPVSYERNLTTVFEERHNLGDPPKIPNKNLINSVTARDNSNHLIKPPERFVDNGFENLSKTINGTLTTSSSQSLASITTTDSLFDFNRQISSFKHSYAQPNHYEQGPQRNANLPPKIPVCDSKLGTSSGASSSNSLSINGLNNGNQQVTSTIGRSISNCTDHYMHSNNLDNDNDTTILSDTSTIHADSNGTVYVNKCAELERTVESLKDKLITKEKELTDLQLKQWSSDYLIDQLKSAVSRLEKEVAQLKSVMVTSNRVKI